MKIFFILFLSINYAALAASKKPGYRESYGGDSSIAEFQMIARNLLVSLSLPKTDKLINIDSKEFESTINNTEIICKSDLEIDGIKKDAINYPNSLPQVIELDCKRWVNNITHTNKISLVAHEYLHLLGINDSNYEHSFKLVRNYFLNEEIIESRNIDFIAASIMCYLDDYNSILQKGVNVFYRNEYGITALEAAIMGGCTPIVQELYPLGFSEDHLIEQFQSLILTIAITSVNAKEGYFSISTSSNERIERSKETIRYLVKKNPKLVHAELRNGFFIAGDLRSYYLTENCYKGSTPLHLIAGGFNLSYFPDSAPISNSQFYNELAELGFSQDQINSCGDSPRSLINKTIPPAI